MVEEELRRYHIENPQSNFSTEQRLRFNMDEIQFFVDCFSIKGFAIRQSLYIDRKIQDGWKFYVYC